MPHTVEEAYELADAAQAGDDAKMVDELGDVLFQVLFLSLLLEERGTGDLASVADACREKLIRRHPHVFGEREASTAGDVIRNWNEIKRDQEQGGELFGHLPENLPATIYARKVLRRAQSGGHEWDGTRAGPGDRLLAAVKEAVDAGEDPELTLRAAADRYRRKVEEDA